MSSSDIFSIFKAVPTLKGSANWKVWISNLEKYMSTRDPNLWRVITGKLKRPSNFATDAEKAAAVTNLQEEIDKAALREARYPEWLSLEMPSPAATVLVAEARNKKLQAEWDNLDVSALFYVKATTSPSMEVYVSKSSSFHVYNHLKSVYGPTSEQEMYEKWVKWVDTTYKSSDPEGFVHEWIDNLEDVIDAYRPWEIVPMICASHQFMKAVSAHEACGAWLSTVKIDLSDNANLIYENL